jgi:hypothetical protein
VQTRNTQNPVREGDGGVRGGGIQSPVVILNDLSQIRELVKYKNELNLLEIF